MELSEERDSESVVLEMKMSTAAIADWHSEAAVAAADFREFAVVAYWATREKPSMQTPIKLATAAAAFDSF